MHGPITPEADLPPKKTPLPSLPPSTLARDGGSAAIDSGAVSKMNGGFRKSILMMEKENGRRGEEWCLMNGEYWDRSEVVTGESDGEREEKEEGEPVFIECTCVVICALANSSDNGSC